jgi:hypothetical protein
MAKKVFKSLTTCMMETIQGACLPAGTPVLLLLRRTPADE